MATSITLTCLAVDGGRNHLGAVFFSLDVSPRESVDFLCDSIKSKLAHQLDHLDGGYRSRKNSFPSKDEFPDPECDVALEGNGPVQILDPEDRISKYWQEDPEKRHLHLIVQLPHDGKRKHEDPVDISMELYDKWNVSLPITPNLTDLEAPLGPEEKMRPFVSDRNKTDEQLLGSNCIRGVLGGLSPGIDLMSPPFVFKSIFWI
ncbi:uncharacterized protein EI90DRAFT_3130990 [Cantharellus anzutake]|uniref:uncharacterized protein n=1 Tax=Cantharellus anzutake TaxID=1750568 RepID=UPI0019061682|nr:uncharacterized protein EI90DRAFT_3130990 [Cantharellus anzutake]KAF8322406.1 hypothetical protein EI90DRAFT_3130990 [Cantharellus anzutake]